MTSIRNILFLFGCALPAFASAASTPLETQFSFALGHGQLQSPVANSTPTTLRWLPRWSVYADQFYMENLDLGWILQEHDDWSVDIVGKANLDAAWFDQTQLRYAMFQGLLDMGHIWLGEGTENNPELLARIIDDTIKAHPRRYSYLAGLQLERRWQSASCNSSWLTDISGVHQGNQLSFACDYLLVDSAFKLAAKVQTRRLSNSFANYYYGFAQADSTTEFWFHPNHFWVPKLELNAAYVFNPTWSISGVVTSERYPAALQASGYFLKRSNLAWFIGVRYTW